MDSSLLSGYSLDQLRDYSVRDRLIHCVYRNHQFTGAPTPLIEQFIVRIDMLIGLALNQDLQPKPVKQLCDQLLHEFGFHHPFQDTLNELRALIERR